jgi:hypothetical protein
VLDKPARKDLSAADQASKGEASQSEAQAQVRAYVSGFQRGQVSHSLVFPKTWGRVHARAYGFVRAREQQPGLMRSKLHQYMQASSSFLHAIFPHEIANSVLACWSPKKSRTL